MFDLNWKFLIFLSKTELFSWEYFELWWKFYDTSNKTCCSLKFYSERALSALFWNCKFHIIVINEWLMKYLFPGACACRRDFGHRPINAFAVPGFQDKVLFILSLWCSQKSNHDKTDDLFITFCKAFAEETNFVVFKNLIRFLFVPWDARRLVSH